MKKRFLLLILPFLAAAVFLVLWQYALHDRSDLKSLAQASAIEAYTRFSGFQETGEDRDYWGGVAAFHSFQSACRLLTENTEKSLNGTLCSAIYGNLLLFPDRGKAHISELVEAMTLLSENIADETGYVQLSRLRIALEHEASPD